MAKKEVDRTRNYFLFFTRLNPVYYIIIRITHLSLGIRAGFNSILSIQIPFNSI